MIGGGNKINTLYPNNSTCFKEDLINEIFTLENRMLDIVKVIEVDVEPSIGEIQLIETDKKMGHDGFVDTGYKLMVEMHIRGKLLYTSYHNNQAIQGIRFEMVKYFSLGVPEQIAEESIRQLYAKGKLMVQPYIEKVYARALDTRTIQCCIAFFLEGVPIK
ncbi:MAG: hypothetical protein ACRDDX_03125 [Cellulosilyticaceae bacterium]